ncbi:LLM class flavin-dependent oxidoreductase [Caulobacter segnis]
MPVANGGWIVSKTTPTLDGLYAQNRAAAIKADQVGMDFVMSMGKFRGFGGETDHWGTSLESVTLMAAIAEATKTVRIWATVHPLLQNPAVAAKMVATLDHISGGRAGLNIVAGAYKAEFDQMSAWDDSLSHDDRYAEGADMGAILAMLANWGVPADRLQAVARKQGAFMTETIVGSPATCREQVEAFMTECELDGLMLIFPDYVEGLAMFGGEILPALRSVFA